MINSGSSPVSRSGRFSSSPSDDVAKYTESISYDYRLWRHDILGSLAHAQMLSEVGVISQVESDAIRKGLDGIAREIEEGTFRWKTELEDVHMNIEAELTRRVPAGAKLHTGRSRNDQVALDMRMWLREEVLSVMREIRDLQHSLVKLGSRYVEVLIPGYTHLQRAQPVFLAHHLLAYVEMLDRDHQRLSDSLRRINVCPLGSGAIAGSTLPLDREFVARLLGFVDGEGRPLVTANSMDAVSDRDFMVEFCANAALSAVHLSRMSEDLILWATSEWHWITIADAYTTGSSLMPQKKNPDIAELTRGKTGRMVGNLVSLLTLLKGLPMAYNRDLQEDKEALFDSVDTLRSALRINAAMLDHTQVNTKACAEAVSDPALLATDLADYLVEQGAPFRQAHHVIGELVALAESRGCTLKDLSLADYRKASGFFGTRVHDLFDLQLAMRRRRMTGAPGPMLVQQQLRQWLRLLNPTPKKSRKSVSKKK